MLKQLPGFLLFLIIIISPFPNQFPQTLPLKENLVDNNFNGPAGLFVRDVDKNGFNDIIGAGSAGNEICVWLHNGENPVTWSKEIVDDNFLGAIYVVAEDINGDSLIDLVGAGWDANQIVWWKNLGGQNPIQWEKKVIDNNSIRAHEVFVCDFENDGDKDIAAASANDNSLALFRNDGGDPIVWSKEIITSNFLGARSVCVGDIDNDNDNDIIGAALISNEVAYWRNDGGEPVVWTKFSISNNFNGAHKVCLYDLDDDQDLDILGTAYAVNQIAWWRNDGGNPVQWTKIIVTNNFTSAVISCPADLDLDGDIDVVGTAQGGNQIAWWRNDGSNPIIWSKIIIKSPFSGAWPLFLADIDNDFDTDILAGAYSADDIVWWENLHYKADFSAEPKSGAIPLEVQFADSSKLNSVTTQWEWDFEFDGVIDSYEQNPVWTYFEEGTYTVYLKVSDGISIDTEIKTEYINASVTNVENTGEAESFNLFQNYPNPFNPSTTISYQLPIASFVSLKIYNLLGKEVRELINEFQFAGNNQSEWNAKDEFGQDVQSGIYFCRLTANGKKFIRKMLLIR